MIAEVIFLNNDSTNSSLVLIFKAFWSKMCFQEFVLEFP